MNNTNHGRWNRYKEENGQIFKLCNGPLHKEGGEWMPLHSFWLFKKGPRKGKPQSRCIACERINKGRDIESGLVPVKRVWFVFVELEARLGKMETCRRLAISQNMWLRAERGIYLNMYRKTAKAAMLLLRELRAQDFARHPLSIRHGAAARGRIERPPKRRYVNTDAHYKRLAQMKREAWLDPEFRKKMDDARVFQQRQMVFK